MTKRFGLAQASLAAMSLALVGCGGGSGGGNVISTPTPTPTPPVSELAKDESFTVLSGSETAQFDLTNGETLGAQATTNGIRIEYDHSTDSYSIQSDTGRSASFTPADESATVIPGERNFELISGTTSEYLTLVYEGYGSGLATRSVALGYWQSNTVDGATQSTDFDVFVYGFESAASAIPVTGSARFTTDVFGFSSQLGHEPMSFQGTGITDFDFARGTFAMDTNISENFLYSGDGRYGALYFRAAGDISSTANAFDGTFSYDGSGVTIAGQLSGSFFGAAANEAGGTFIGDDGAGNSVVGGFTAVDRGTSSSGPIDDPSVDRLFYTAQSRYEQRRYKDGTPGWAYADINNGQLSYRASDKSYRVAGYTEDEGLFTPADIVSETGDEFEVYRINNGTQDIELAMYQPKNGREIELSYSGFGVYRRTFEDANQYNFTQHWFGYGIDTLEGVLDGRTGTGTYEGIARGIAGSSDGQRDFDVSGVSHFEIDFGTQNYSGWLDLLGTDTSDGSEVSFGLFDLVEGSGFPRNAFATGLQQDGEDAGAIQLRFYGPTGQELGGAFSINTADYGISGATTSVRK